MLHIRVAAASGSRLHGSEHKGAYAYFTSMLLFCCYNGYEGE